MRPIDISESFLKRTSNRFGTALQILHRLSARALLFSKQHFKLNKYFVLLLHHQVILTQQHILLQIICVAELASHNAVTAPQVIYSASSVAERIVGSFHDAEKIYSAVKLLNFINLPPASTLSDRFTKWPSSIDMRIVSGLPPSPSAQTVSHLNWSSALPF
jgi:hypothetical protein